ncbi:MAG: translocation/assembly module TamB [Flavobacteriales bacterium]|nr:translocation/assembly module TamB [Flavobacteriales bacterium]
MLKVIKKAIKVTALVLLLLLLMQVIVLMLLRLPTVQTKLVQYIASEFSAKIGTPVSIRYIALDAFKNLTLEGLYIEDKQADSLIYIGNLQADFSVQWKPLAVSVKMVAIDSLTLHLKKYKQPREYNIDYIIEALSSNDKDTSESEPFDIKVTFGDLKITNSTIYYNDYKWPAKERVIFDENRLAIYNTNVTLKNIQFDADTIRAQITQLSANEKSGFKVNNLIADFSVSATKTVLNAAEIYTPHSTVFADITFLTDSFPDFNEFISNVYWDADVKKSTISFADINYFSRAFDDVYEKVEFESKIKGTIDNFKMRQLNATFHSGTHVKGNLDMKGLPDENNTYLYFDVKELEANKKSIEKMYFLFGEDSMFTIPDNFYHLGNLKYKGILSGFFNDVVAYGDFQTNLGVLRTDISLKYDNLRNKTSYSGRLRTQGFNAGNFFYLSPDLGNVALDAKINGEGFTLETIDCHFDGTVFSFELLGYNYKNIVVNGNLKNQKFSGKLDVKDPNLDFDFEGTTDFTGKMPVMDFTANIRSAKLATLELFNKSDTNTNFSTTVKLSLTGNNIDNITGSVEMLNTFYADSDEKFTVNAVDFFIDDSGKEKIMVFTSDILDGEIQGKFNLRTLPLAFEQLLSNYIPAKFSLPSEDKKLQDNFRFNIEFIDPEDVLHALTGFLRIGSNSSLSGKLNLAENDLYIKGNATFIDIYDLKLKNCLITGKSLEKSLYLNFGSNRLIINDSIYFENFNLNNQLLNDSLYVNSNWENNSLFKNNGDLNSVTVFKSKNRIENSLLNSSFTISDSLWRVNNHNKIILDSGFIKIENLSLKTNASSVVIDGVLSDNPSHQIDAVLTNFDINYLNPIINDKNIRIDGLLNGTLSISKFSKNPVLNSNVSITDFSLNESLLGNGNIVSIWNKETETITLNGDFKRENIPVLDFKGTIFPTKKGQELSIQFVMNKTDLNIIEYFSEGVLSNVKGFASGIFGIYGSVHNPITDGSLVLEKVSFKVDYLNTTYSMKGTAKLEIEEDMVALNNALMLDEKGNTAFVNATLFHNQFKEITYDIGIHSKNLLMLNTSIAQNDLYYGTAFLSGDINIAGYGEQLLIDANIKTEKGTYFNIPLNGPEEVSEYGFIKFISRTDTLNLLEAELLDLTGVVLAIDLTMTTDAEVKLIFDEKVGDIMRGRGTGNIKMDINTNGDFNMMGDYVIEEGDYLFTLQNVINKKFVIEKGGKIRWNGSPYEAEIDIYALYKLRAALNDVIQDSSDIYKKRVPVDLRMHLFNNLMQPDIDFDIHLPTVDEGTKQRVRSVLYVNNNETNNQEMNRQVFALLVLNRFLTPSGLDPTTSNNADNPNFGAQSSSELLSNQISNWLSQISNQFDVGFAYRPGSELTNDEVELALSTQIFNDRVVLDGNVGYLNNANISGNSSNVVGDFSVEYKVVPDGKLRVKAFNRSNVNNFMLNNAPYTQGVGFFYRKDFDRFKDIFKSKKKKKLITDKNQQQEKKPTDTVE